MCDKNCDPELSLESILKRNHGLFDVQIKVNIRDTEGLSLAYTPGVGTPCLEIQKDQSKAYQQTNKGNNILVLTDSSKFAGENKCNYLKKTVEGKTWNNNASMPYLESFTLYYKHATNVDAYPMLLDLALIKDAETLLDTVNAVSLLIQELNFLEFVLKEWKNSNNYSKSYQQNQNMLFLTQIEKWKLMKCFPLKRLY